MVHAREMGDASDKIASNTTMIVSVRYECDMVGRRNALTPLLTASTPVMAVQPLAKARMIQTPAVSIAAGNSGGDTTAAKCPALVSDFAKPNPSIPSMQVMNR